MPVYLFAYIEVNDADMYSRYVENARPIIKQYGGRYLVQGGDAVPLSGDWAPKRVIVIEFDTVERLQQCFRSSEYRAIAPLREQSTRSRSIILQGCAP
jgi:uncharacterized protein (DUF1330 family)